MSSASLSSTHEMTPKFSIQLTAGGFEKFLKTNGGIDFRLNDERWHTMNTGDVFEFIEDPGEKRRYSVKILSKHHAPNFSSLLDALPHKLFNPAQKQAYLDFFLQWWSPEQEAVNGVLALEITVLANTFVED